MVIKDLPSFTYQDQNLNLHLFCRSRRAGIQQRIDSQLERQTVVFETERLVFIVIGLHGAYRTNWHIFEQAFQDEQSTLQIDNNFFASIQLVTARWH